MIPNRSTIFFLIGGISLGLAWHFPSAHLASFLGLCSVFLLILPFRLNLKLSYKGIYLFGISSHLIAFYWIYNTIKDFGGYPPIPAFLIFLLFVILHSIQFPLFLLIRKNLDFIILDRFKLSNFLAFITAEFFSFKIFPWYFGHSFSSLKIFTQIADIAGVLSITLFMFLIVEFLIDLIFFKKLKRSIVGICSIHILVGVYGLYQINHLNSLIQNKLKVSLIQADIGIFEKNNVKYLSANTNKYYKLSNQALKDFSPDLIIWPESAITDFVNLDVKNALDTNALPFFDKTNFLVGTLSQNNLGIYNSAVGIKKDYSLTQSYHKQILMPFGEYMPLANIFPVLNDFNPNVANFIAGEKVEVFSLDYNIKVSPLICYEDIIPSLARDATNKGANLLTNLTNDAWFGNTIASKQHNLIASFRAIENKRFLLRSTNSGLTSVINPLGETISEIPVFSENILNARVDLLNIETIYSKYLGEKIWYFLIFITTVLFLWRFRKNYE